MKSCLVFHLVHVFPDAYVLQLHSFITGAVRVSSNSGGRTGRLYMTAVAHHMTAIAHHMMKNQDAFSSWYCIFSILFTTDYSQNYSGIIDTCLGQILHDSSSTSHDEESRCIQFMVLYISI